MKMMKTRLAIAAALPLLALGAFGAEPAKVRVTLIRWPYT